jgi:cell division protein FtsZ
VDDVLRQGVQGISDLITKPGIVNVDFADVRAILGNSGSALMGIGVASGENRAAAAAKSAINSPLLELSIDGAKGVLFNVTGSSDITMLEINEAANIITEAIDPNAKVIFGAVMDDQVRKGELQITVVATGFDPEKVSDSRSSFGFMGSNRGKNEDIEESEQDEKKPEEKPKQTTRPLRETIAYPQKKREPSVFITDEKVSQRPTTPSSLPDSDADDDEDLEIPAFIRRKMRK